MWFSFVPYAGRDVSFYELANNRLLGQIAFRGGPEQQLKNLILRSAEGASRRMAAGEVSASGHPSRRPLRGLLRMRWERKIVACAGPNLLRSTSRTRRTRCR